MVVSTVYGILAALTLWNYEARAELRVRLQFWAGVAPISKANCSEFTGILGDASSAVNTLTDVHLSESRF